MASQTYSRRGVVLRAAVAVGAVLLLSLVGLLASANSGPVRGGIVIALAAGALLALVIVLVSARMLEPEDLRSRATERTLRVASGTLKYMSEGLTEEDCKAVCQLLLPETAASAIAITDLTKLLAYVGVEMQGPAVGTPNSVPTMQVIQSGRMQTFSNMDVQEDPRIADEERRGDLDPVPYPMGIIAPLTVRDHVVGAIKLYYARGSEVDRTQLAIARGLAELLSTQLSAYELDRQAELTARAEVKALQAQINPHFLFNTLNTIASLTRTDPAKARDLLREFAVFYRKTLQSSQQTIPLSEELAQTRRYLKIEKARFGEDRIIETENVETGCDDVLVPGFIVQPIVENAVRHAMRDDGPLHIDVQAVVDGGDIMIAVADDGLGMDESVAERLLSGSSQESSDSSKGTGIALKNVAERLERFYGTGSGVEIMSKVGEGTCVTLRLVGAAPALQQCTEA